MAKVPITAGILVGGKSSRFGRPKAIEQLPNGKTVLAHVIEVARVVADDVVLLGASDAISPDAFDCHQLSDPDGVAGPIGGLSSLLAHANDQWGLLLACDLPLLRPELFDPMMDAVRDDGSLDAVAYTTGLARRPFYACCALYHPRILATVQDAIGQGQFRLQAVLQSVRTHLVEPDESQSQMLQDMNTPEDKSRLLS